MLLDDAGMWNQYMVRHRIAVRADANIVLELTDKLKAYVSDFLRRLQSKARGVDPYAENTQKFMGDWHTLLEDFEMFAGQVMLADALELQAMLENLDYWEQRCEALPEIPAPREYPAPPKPDEEGVAHQQGVVGKRVVPCRNKVVCDGLLGAEEGGS